MILRFVCDHDVDAAVAMMLRGAFTAHAVTPTVLRAVRREAMRDLLLPRE